MSIRDRVQQIGTEMLAGDPSPADARRHEVMLSGLLAHINKALAAAEVDYKRHLNELRAGAKTAADAKMQAEASPAYEHFAEAKATRDSAMEMLRTLRSFTRSLGDEMRLGR